MCEELIQRARIKANLLYHGELQRDILNLADALEAAEKELIDYHHTQKTVDGKMSENARLHKINEQLTARVEKAEAERDKLAAFIKWTDDNFNHYMPTEYVNRLLELEARL